MPSSVKVERLSAMNNRPGFMKFSIIVILIVCAGIVVGSFWITGSGTGSRSIGDALTFEVYRGEFVASIVEPGDIESSSNVEIRCRVKSQGRAGTAILKIIPEGEMVKEGDFLCQLDDSVLRDQLIEQKIQVAKDRAAVIQAESDLNTAKQMLKEFENGTYAQEKAVLEAEKAFAEETLRRSREYHQYSERLNTKGYITRTQLEADRFAVEKAEKELELAKQKLDVYREYTKERTTGELQAEIDKQEANLEAAQFTLELSQQREKDIREQKDACRITAPSDGQLVYANEIDGRGDTSFVIEEGASMRDGQPIFRLPDPTQMQVVTHVNDSKINSVKIGQEALIRLDTDPDNPVRGVVKKVAAFPLPRRWYQAPIEYIVHVQVVDVTESVRPGLRAKVEIFVDRQQDQLMAPIASLVTKGPKQLVLLKSGDQIQVREVEIGANNESFVIIKDGLEPGDQVLIDPERFENELKLNAE